MYKRNRVDEFLDLPIMVKGSDMANNKPSSRKIVFEPSSKTVSKVKYDPREDLQTESKAAQVKSKKQKKDSKAQALLEVFSDKVKPKKTQKVRYVAESSDDNGVFQNFTKNASKKIKALKTSSKKSSTNKVKSDKKSKR